MWKDAVAAVWFSAGAQQERMLRRPRGREVSTPKGIKGLTTFLEASGAFTRTCNKRTKTKLPIYEDKPEVDGLTDEDDEDEENG